jgi:vacuolar-type H+-ATPase subunit C/Vma6
MGNTRLRARLGGLLAPAELTTLDHLAGDHLLVWLKGTAYGRHLSHGEPAYAVALAAQARLREVLRATAQAYPAGARDVVTALLCPEDVADLVTLVRSVAREVPAPAVQPLLHAVGRLAGGPLADVVAADPMARVSRLAALHALDDRTRRAVTEGAERFERTGDLAAWEVEVAASAWRHADEVVRRAGRAAREARHHLAATRDVANVVTALRLRGTPPARSETVFLPPGSVPWEHLARLAAGEPPERLVPPGWVPAVRRHVEVGDPDGLARELESDVAVSARRLLRHGDPLGVALTVGFVASARHEAARVRLAARAARGARAAGVAA